MVGGGVSILGLCGYFLASLAMGFYRGIRVVVVAVLLVGVVTSECKVMMWGHNDGKDYGGHEQQSWCL